jgi:drug/metabolite transporter (DMT)-like permease
MGQPVDYAIAAMVCYGFADFIYKQAASAGIRADHFLMAQGWFVCPLVFLYALATHTLVLDPVALWGSLAGVFIFIGFHYFFQSLITGSVSTNASIFRMNFIVTVILVVVLLGDPLTVSTIAGLALSLLAVWLLLGAGNNAASTPKTERRSLVQIVIATLAFGTSNFFHTVGLRHGAVPETLAVAQAALFMPIATVAVYFTDRTPRAPPVTFGYGAAAAIMLVGATIFLLRGLAVGRPTVLVPIAQMGFIITALLGILLLRERVTIRKVAGLFLAFATLVVLTKS